jgi:hypothetical protein
MKRKGVTLPSLKKKCQIIFNDYIRLRDKDQPCISCGEFKPLQAGHYYACGGYDGLRFNEDNVHGECVRCNCFDESHLIGYGENLKERIGIERFEKLKLDAKIYKAIGYKFSRLELIDLIAKYREEIKELTKN